MRSSLRCTMVVLSLLGSACQVESLFPVRVGDGAARLTVQNAGVLLSVVNTDAHCGFGNEDVMADYTVEGEVGQVGKITWTVQGCELDFGLDPNAEPVTVSSDCTGAETRVKGRIIVDATRTIEGLLTGNPETPVVPQSPDAVTLTMHAVVFGYRASMGEAAASALIKQGIIDLKASVHLARSASLGVCSVPTNAITIDSLVVSDAAYEIDDGEGHVFDVPVRRADLSAQVGSYRGRENEIKGTINVWNNEVSLAHDQKLDPDYDSEAFVQGFACVEDLQLPLEYACESLAPRLAEGAAKLTINTVGNIVSAFSKDTSCGLKSSAVRAAAEVTGEVGREGGTATYRIDEPCVIDFGEARVMPGDCVGYSPTISGRAAFTGSLEVRGRRTGNPDEPIIPTSRDAATLRFRLVLEDAAVQGSAPEVMEVAHGVVSGTMYPRLAIDTVTGACSVDTPVVSFDDVTWEPGVEATIRASGNALGITIESSSLDAQNGKKGERENYLAGEIVVGGERYAIPLDDGEPTLDPGYDADEFRDGWLCGAVREPSSDDECDMHQVIADGVARLIIQTAGTVAGAINSDEDCGFSNKMDVLKNPTIVEGHAGQMGSLTWAVHDCPLGPGATPAVYATDCIGGTTHWVGSANVDSTRTVRGMREDVEVPLLGRVADSIAPQSPESVDLWLTDVALDEFSSWALAPGQQEPLGILTIHNGTLDAFLKPITGWSEEQERYTVATPVATLQGVHLRNAQVTLEAQGMTFVLDVADSNLFAVNGRAGLSENTITGTVTIDGDVVQVGGALNPDYDADELAASWACNVAPEMGACDQVGRSDVGLGALLLLVSARWRRRRG
ncbi:MAG: hypothetical protein IT383_12655 [Deltaproteobacteria bacterium]|nr:hypothetical protein [Deltaproteobacteria bacterium]